MFLGRREEGEGVVHTDVSGDSRTEKEQRTFHETFLIFWKKTSHGENVALSNLLRTYGCMIGLPQPWLNGSGGFHPIESATNVCVLKMHSEDI